MSLVLVDDEVLHILFIVLDNLTGIFHQFNPFGRIGVLGSTQLLTDVSKGKGHPATGRGGPRGSG